MADKPDSEGRVLIQVRLPLEEAKQLDALQEVLDRDSRSSMARVLIKERMRQLMADPVILAQVEAALRERSKV